jgi:hypothetical protein
MIVHDRNVAGELGKAAIQRGVAAAGGSVAGVSSYEFSQTASSGGAGHRRHGRATRAPVRCS